MFLDLEQIRFIACGVTRVEQDEDGYFRFFRFTDAQSQVYLDAGIQDFYNKSFGSAGVRLAFRTDSKRFAFHYRLKTASARKDGWFDVYENGVLIEHFGCPDESIREAHIEIPLQSGESEVEIYFPWTCRTDLKSVEMTDGATLHPICRSKRMICFGDSITHGYYALYPSLTYASHIARMLDADEINKGIGGERFRSELLKEADPIPPDLITVGYSTNDWNFITPAEFEEKCTAFYKRLTELYPKAEIYAISPVWRTDAEKETPYGTPCYTVHQQMEKICERYANVHLIRGWDLVPHVKEFYGDLWLHPNDMGFGIYTENLYREIQKTKNNKNTITERKTL